MTVAATSLAAFQETREQMGRDEQIIFDLLLEIGPAPDIRILEALRQRESKKRRNDRRKWEISTITGRRDGCRAKGWVSLKGYYRHSSGARRNGWAADRTSQRPYMIWAVWNDDREPVGDWVRLSDEEVAGLKSKAEERKQKADNHRKTILRKVFSPSDVGRALVACRYAKQAQRPVAKSQMTLFA